MPRLLLLLLVALLAPSGTAAAQSSAVERAAQALRNQPVYQDPSAERALGDADLSGVRAAIARSEEPVFIAILPDTAGPANGVVVDVARATGRDGTYAVIVGNSLRAVSTRSQRAAVAESRAALEANRDEGAAAVLEDFVRRTAEPGIQADGAGDSGATGDGRGRGEGGGGFPFLGVLLLAGLALFAFRAVGRSRRRRDEHRSAFADVRRTAEDDIAAIANDITELDDDVEAAGAPPAAKEAYLRALDHYTRADEALRRAATIDELQRVAEVAADGRYEMAVARAHLEGHPVPERRPPCFFDPRHGPSVVDAEYAPRGGQPREVPVCRACSVRLEEGEEPDARSEWVGGRQVPYWAAPSYGYYGGAFGGFGTGLLGGLLLGSMFDSPAYGADFGAGDFGGGDFGGGDFGGGGFGGGDFGGGDF